MAFRPPAPIIQDDRETLNLITFARCFPRMSHTSRFPGFDVDMPWGPFISSHRGCPRPGISPRIPGFFAWEMAFWNHTWGLKLWHPLDAHLHSDPSLRLQKVLLPRAAVCWRHGRKGVSETLPKLLSFHVPPFRKLLPALGSPTLSLGSLSGCGWLSFSTAPSQPVRSHGADAGRQEDPPSLQELLSGMCGALERQAGGI